MEADTELIKILPVETLPENKRKPVNRVCEKCGRLQVLSGYYEYNGFRHWIYLPGACICWETKSVKEPI